MKVALNRKFGLFLLICFTLALALAGCGGEEPEAADEVTLRIAALKGPTGMGMAKLMELNPDDSYTIESAPDAIVAKLTAGDVDIAALPTNVAAALYNKTGGDLQVAAINTLGVLYILTSSDEVKTLADLKGKTIVASGQGTTAQYILEHILAANGLTVGDDVTVDYRSEHSEVATLALAGEGELFLLPEPFVTSVRMKDDAIRVAFDLTEEWDDADESKTPLPMGCIVVRKAFLEAQPEAFRQFLTDYQTSTEFVNNNPAEAAQLIAEHGIMEAAVAEKAIPNSNIVFVIGPEMKKALVSFYEVLYEANPAAIGGQMPADDFYHLP